MLKLSLARLRWGNLSPEQREELNTMGLRETFLRPYLASKFHKHY